MQDGTILEAALIANTTLSSVISNDFIVPGQVVNVEPSPLALPPRIVQASFNTPEHLPFRRKPLLVAISGSQQYLAPPGSYFYQVDNLKGSDVDTHWHDDPSEDEHKKGHYQWGSNLEENMTFIIV